MEWRYEEHLLVICTLGFFSTMTARLVISPIIPEIVAAFGVSKGLIGLAITGMWLFYGFAMFPAGLLSDIVGEKIVIVASLFFTAVFSISLALAPVFPIFIVAAAVLGLVAGFHYVPATSLLTKQYPKTGRAMGVFITGGSLGGLLAPSAAVVISSQFGWRAAIGFSVLVALPVFALSLRRIRPPNPEKSMNSSWASIDFGGTLGIMLRPDIAFMTGLAILGIFIFQATATFLPLFLIEYHHLTQSTAGFVFSAYFGILALSQPILGEFSDRYGRDLTMVIEFGSGAGGFGLLLFGNGVAVLPAIVLVAIAMSFGGPLQARFMDRFADSNQGKHFGLARTVFMMVGSLGNVTVGMLADVAGWLPAFGLLMVFAVVVIAALVANYALNLRL